MSDDAASVVAAARAMNAAGINRAVAGNVSVRRRTGFLITPSAVPYDRLSPGSIVPMDMDGEPAGPGIPSTEWRIHRDVYAGRPDAGAVIHAHPPFATAVACLRRDIPPFHYMVAVAGGTTIRCAPYATFGTPELAARVVEALEGRRACLLANHGMVALGADLEAALRLAIEVESLAEIYWRALQVGEPVLLTDDEMAAALAGFAEYGRG